jgi:AraC-like DNA-binding protein
VRQIGDTGDDLFFGITAGDVSSVRQGRQEVTVGGGDALVVEPGGRFGVLRPGPSRLVGIRVPRDAVAASAAGCALRVVPARTPALRLLTAYLRGLVGQPAPDAPPLADAVARHVTELIELSLAGDLALPTAAGGVRAARLSAIRADVDRHLTDPALNAAAVARRTGIGTRYLHRLFEDEPTTFSRFVLDRRLDLVHHRLRDPRFAARTLAALAADAGFGDLSYFNRTFRRRFGMTPSEIRALHDLAADSSHGGAGPSHSSRSNGRPSSNRTSRGDAAPRQGTVGLRNRA